MANYTERNGTFRIRVSCGYDVRGRQIMKSKTYRPKPGMSDKAIQKELQRQIVLFEEECKQGQEVISSKFETFAELWLKDYAEIKLKRHSVRFYNSMKQCAYNALGHKRVDKISPLDIQRYVTHLVEKGYAPSTVRNHVRFVSVVLEYARKKRILNFNPCSTVDYPALNDRKMEIYSVEEVNYLLEKMWNGPSHKKAHAMFFILAANTGARRGELLGLEWKDIDFDKAQIYFSRAYYYSSHHRECYTDTLKSTTSRRVVELSEHAMSLLKEYQEWQNAQKEICGDSWIESDRILTKLDGKNMHPNTPGYYLGTICENLGMPKRCVHSFRHFNASVLIRDGVDVVTVQTALGHAKPSTTLNLYSHAFDTAQTRAKEAVSRAISF